MLTSLEGKIKKTTKKLKVQNVYTSICVHFLLEHAYVFLKTPQKMTKILGFSHQPPNSTNSVNPPSSSIDVRKRWCCNGRNGMLWRYRLVFFHQKDLKSWVWCDVSVLVFVSRSYLKKNLEKKNGFFPKEFENTQVISNVITFLRWEGKCFSVCKSSKRKPQQSVIFFWNSL